VALWDQFFSPLARFVRSHRPLAAGVAVSVSSRLRA
jgi:hypothetical protein